MKFKDFILELAETQSNQILQESIHQNILNIMEDDSIPKRNSKLNRITKTMRKLISEGEDTGFQDDGSYKTNPHGVLAPVLDSHKDSHWLEMGHARNMTRKEFSDATKTDTHPKGLDFDLLHKHLVNLHAEAHGQNPWHHLSDEQVHHVESHPMFDNVKDFMDNSGNHPGDLRLQNWGMWSHPITGKEHPVIRDWGFSNEINKKYNIARKKKAAESYLRGRY